MTNKERLETLETKVDSLHQTVHNHVLTKLKYLDWQTKFVIAIMLAMLAVVLASTFGG